MDYDILEAFLLTVFLFIGAVIWKIHSDNDHGRKGLTKLRGTSKKGHSPE